MLAAVVVAVVEVPELRALVLRVPLAELVAEREEALLGARLLLVAAGAAHDRVESVRLDRVEQRGRLEPVARRAGAQVFDDAPAVDGVLHGCDHEAGAEPLDGRVAERDHLGKVVARIHVHDGERQLRGPERLGGGVRHDDAVLAAGEEQHRPLELGRDLTQEVDRLGFERRQVRKRSLACDCFGRPVGSI